MKGFRRTGGRFQSRRRRGGFSSRTEGRKGENFRGGRRKSFRRDNRFNHSDNFRKRRTFRKKLTQESLDNDLENFYKKQGKDGNCKQ